MRKQPRSNLLNALSDLHLLIFMATSDMLPLKVRLKKEFCSEHLCAYRGIVLYISVSVLLYSAIPHLGFSVADYMHQVVRLLLT